MPGTLFVVATPIGNLEDITARALRVLRHVVLIAAEDTRRTAHLLTRYAISTPTTSLHAHNEARKAPSLVDRLRRGQDVALVSDAGTPTISDPGQRLVRAAIDAGIRVEPIPGPSALITALTASGLPGETFTFLGFPPIRLYDRNEWLKSVCTAGRTVVFFEAPHRVRATLERIRRMAGDRTVVVGRELTKAHEELVRGPISEVLSRLPTPRGEFTVVVDICHSTEYDAFVPAGDDEILREFCYMTDSGRLPRRRAINAIGHKYGRTPNDVYQAIERAKKLVK